MLACSERGICGIPIGAGPDLSICHVEFVIVIAAKHRGALKATADLKTLRHQPSLIEDDAHNRLG